MMNSIFDLEPFIDGRAVMRVQKDRELVGEIRRIFAQNQATPEIRFNYEGRELSVRRGFRTQDIIALLRAS